jgi:hypothetical protein
VGALPGLTPLLYKELVSKAYRGDFNEVENIKHVWRKTIEVGNNEFTVIAVQTQP